MAGTAVCDGGIVIDLSGMKGIRIDPLIARLVEPEKLHGVNLVMTCSF